MKKKFPELLGWVFEMEETSACVYKVIGKDKYGRKVSRQGTELDELLDECKSDALAIQKSLDADS